MLRELNAELTTRLGDSGQWIADGKPLIVSGYSKDRDATRGYVPGGFARGYKLHAIRDAVSGVIVIADTRGLADGEATVLRPMLRRLPRTRWLIRADANYDSVSLYTLAAARGGRLIAPRRKRGRGIGHHRQHPDRLAAIAELEGGGGTIHRRWRSDIERAFADLGNIAGLFALPPFVRRRRRVRRWVRIKLLLYHLSLMLRRTKT